MRGDRCCAAAPSWSGDDGLAARRRFRVMEVVMEVLLGVSVDAGEAAEPAAAAPAGQRE
jgi:hypothetical protein